MFARVKFRLASFCNNFDVVTRIVVSIDILTKDQYTYKVGKEIYCAKNHIVHFLLLI